MGWLAEPQQGEVHRYSWNTKAARRRLENKVNWAGLRKRGEQLLTFRRQAVVVEAAFPALTSKKASGSQAPERCPNREVVIAFQAEFNGPKRQLPSGHRASGGGTGEHRMFNGTLPDNVRWAGRTHAAEYKKRGQGTLSVASVDAPASEAPSHEPGLGEG